MKEQMACRSMGTGQLGWEGEEAWGRAALLTSYFPFGRSYLFANFIFFFGGGEESI